MTIDTDVGRLLPLDGLLTLKAVAQGREALIEAMDVDTDVVIDVSDQCEVDVAGIQLIESARRTARDQQKTLRLARPASGKLSACLTRAGFLHPDRAADALFWTGNIQADDSLNTDR